MNDKAIRTYRLGFPQFLVGLLTLAAVAGGVAWILKQFGVI
ncbi:MAG TPA: hypothetical protein VNR37_03910 [Microbacteriaceae bacterium]|nr:hypothetical protein [Microbacteriaceae bacterium]